MNITACPYGWGRRRLADLDVVLLTPVPPGERAHEAGFAQVVVQKLIAETTKVLTGTKPR